MNYIDVPNVPEIKCNNRKIEKILNRIVGNFPFIMKPIFAYVGNDEKEFEHFISETYYIEEMRGVLDNRCAACLTTDKIHILFVNKKNILRWLTKKTLTGCCAHELAHMELSYNVDIEISLSSKLIEKAESSKSDPRRYIKYHSERTLADNEYLTDVLTIGRGFAWELLSAALGSGRSFTYMNSVELMSFLRSADRQPYVVRRKDEIPDINGFCVTEKCYGDFVKSKPHGVVKLVFREYTYTGYHEGDTLKGVCIEKSGTMSYGYYIEGSSEGYGIDYYKDGSVFAGEWLLGKKNGDGTLYGPDGRVKIRGKWINDLPPTQEMPDSDECIRKESKYSVYYGDQKDGVFHGYGKLTLSNGDVFVGEFENGHYSKGAYLFKNGDIYYGDLKDSKRSGHGAYFFKKGHVCIGEWKNDQRTGDGKIHGPGGIVKDGWQDIMLFYTRKTRIM